MSVQGSINTVLGVAAAGKKLDQMSSKMRQPASAPAQNMASAKKAERQPIPVFDMMQLSKAKQEVSKNLEARKSQSKNWRNRRAALRERKGRTGGNV